jgi:nuclear pore complex protein Nup54
MYLTIMFLGTGKIMRIVEALENRGFRVQLSKEEADLYERLVAIIKQVSFFCPHIVFVFGWLWILCSCIFCIQIKGTGGDLSKRTYNLLSTSRLLASTGGASGPIYIPNSAKVDEQSVTDLLEVRVVGF